MTVPSAARPTASLGRPSHMVAHRYSPVHVHCKRGGGGRERGNEAGRCDDRYDLLDRIALIERVSISFVEDQMMAKECLDCLHPTPARVLFSTFDKVKGTRVALLTLLELHRQ